MWNSGSGDFFSTSSVCGGFHTNGPITAASFTGSLTNATGLPLNGVVSPTGAIAAIALGANELDFTSALTTDNTEGTTFEEATAATGGTAGNQFRMEVSTLAGSTATPLRVANSLTGSQVLPTLTSNPTWNTTGVVDAGIFQNITCTAAPAGALAFDFQAGAASGLSLKYGAANCASPQLVLAAGTDALPSLTFASSVTTGFASTQTNSIDVALNGIGEYRFAATTLKGTSTAIIGWGFGEYRYWR